MTFDWGMTLLIWAVTVFSLGIAVLVGGIAAFVIDTRRHRPAAVTRRDGERPRRAEERTLTRV